MNLKLPRGKYVVAVSGGVDSMALLHMLVQKRQQKAKNKLIVAHFNHGIRPNAQKDEELVKKTAQKYNLPFEVGYGHLGPGVNEEQARKARYKFLNEVKQKYKTDAIVTAHHEDDLIETAIINILRGSGRRGMSAIIENPDIRRPLLPYSKKDILSYAKKNHLSWREDPTNKDERYLRNYIRRRIVPKLSTKQRAQLLQDIKQVALISQLINQEIANLSQKIVKGNAISRNRFIILPSEVANEVLIHFLRAHGIRQFDKKTIERLSVAIKTARAGSKLDVIKGASMEMTPSEVVLHTGFRPAPE